MSLQLVSLNPDLKRLMDEGFEVEISGNGFLLIHSVPYVNSKREIARGTLASSLTLAGERTVRPDGHTVMFTGDEPCQQDGTVIKGISHGATQQTLGPGLVSRYSFSNKPKAGYEDYYAKMTRYIEIISHPAISIDPSCTARTFKVVTTDTDSVFVYLDTASSRAGISAVNAKLTAYRIGIVGTGGSGGYVLDFVAKTPVAEIHLFDADDFLQHNAFRAPGAASIEDLSARPKKVHYLQAKYSKMHRRIIAHDVRVDETNIGELAGLNFVFVCLDKGEARCVVVTKLQELKIPFVDVGMGIELVPDEHSLVGIVRTTASSAAKSEHAMARMPLGEDKGANEYASNIQIAELNALNAAFAVIRWKKFAGFYRDDKREHNSTFTLNTNQLLSDESPDD